MKRRTWIAVIVTVAVLGCIATGWLGLWTSVTRTTVHGWGWMEDHRGQGQSTIITEQRLRIGGERHGRYQEHYWLNGFLARDSIYEGGWLLRSTTWRPDGSVRRQEWRAVSSGGQVHPRQRTEPPWEWGVEAQTGPTAPWWDAEQGCAVWWPEEE